MVSMVIEDYLTLSVPEQWSELFEYGTHLVYFKGRNHDYNIYALHNFFVEVITDPATEGELAKNVYKNADFMERYIRDLKGRKTPKSP